MATRSSIEITIQSLKSKIEEARIHGDYKSIIEASKEILKIASEHPELNIAEFIFLRKIAKAFEKLGDNKSALSNFKQCLASVKELEKRDYRDFTKEVLALKGKIEYLSKNCK